MRSVQYQYRTYIHTLTSIVYFLVERSKKKFTNILSVILVFFSNDKTHMNTLRLRTSESNCANSRQQTYVHNLSLSLSLTLNFVHMKIIQRDADKNVEITSRFEGQDIKVEVKERKNE